MTENTHRVEVFVEDAFDGSGRRWGWQCFAPGCGIEETGWATYVEAEAAAEIHREVCVAQAAIRHSDFGMDSRVSEHKARIGRLIEDIDRQRPLGPDGKHDDRHTATCGCEDR